MKFEHINLRHSYRGDFYRITTIERADRASVQLRVYNETTKFIKYTEFSYSFISISRSHFMLHAGEMISSVWMRKYTTVDTKLGVATSELMEALLC